MGRASSSNKLAKPSNMLVSSSYVLVVLHGVFVVATQSAQGSEELSLEWCKSRRAKGTIPALHHPANVEVLMDSWNYRNLLPDRVGAVWQQVDYDNNNDMQLTTNVSRNEYRQV